MPSRWILPATAIAVVVFVALVGLGSGLIVDALWFREVGFSVVFRTTLVARILTFLTSAIGTFIVVAGVALWVERQTRGHGVVRIVLRRQGDGGVTLPELIAPIAERLPWRALIMAVAAVLSLLAGLGQAAGASKLLLGWYGGIVGETDPLFGRDLGFFLFRLPALRSAVAWALSAAVLAGLVSAAVLWLRGTLDVQRASESLPAPVLRAASLVLALFFVAKAGDYWLGRYELLLGPYGAVFGAGITTVRLRVPLQTFLTLVALAGAALSAANLRGTPGWRRPVGAVVLVFGLSILSSMLPDLYQRLRVRPDELRLERPYLERNIAMTRKAYGLDRIKARPFAATATLDSSSVEKNRDTFVNVRLWDPGPLLATYRQLQVIRLYYAFHDIDVDRYALKSGLRQVMLAAREIEPSLLPQNARTWVNQRLQFTHGFGAVMSPVTEFEGEGLPRFFLKDIPPRSEVGIEIAEPRIYYGERSDEYVIVNAAAEEFDYPKGDENVTNSYSGKGGLRIGSLLRRLVFAWRFRDLNLLISGNLRSDSRILFRRAIAERIGSVAPFLRLDHDPYLVISNGRLYWVQDAYTTASTYPYSEPLPGLRINYIRNSVKIVVDAYDGAVDFYAADAAEPVLAAWARIYPGLFRPIAEMPEDLRRHIRYPEDLFLVQAEMYRAYHMTNPDVFYNKEDYWNFPTETVEGSRSALQPYYIIMKLPGGDSEEFLLMQPMTPANRSNMVAWLAARCDAPNYGELVEYQFPKERLIYGPQQIEARIDQDTLISQQLSLWNQMGSKVIRGNLLVIPVEESIVYVEPLYLRSEQAQIPELKRVIVAYDDRLAMEPSLEAALAVVFKGQAPSKPPAVIMAPQTAPAPAPQAGEAPGSARDHYQAALERLRAGDWSGFGREMEALGRSLE